MPSPYIERAALRAFGRRQPTVSELSDQARRCGDFVTALAWDRVAEWVGCNTIVTNELRHVATRIGKVM